MRIQHNIMAMNAYRNYTTNTSALSKNLEKLSSGYKINRAGDDAAGLAISEKMRAQITGLETAQKNAKDGISLVQTAEGALTEVHDMLNRMVELATQSANSTYDNKTDRDNLQKEVDQLLEEIDRIADSSNFNGINLLDGSMDAGAVNTNVVLGTMISGAGWLDQTTATNPVPGTNFILHQDAKPGSNTTTFEISLDNLSFDYISGTVGNAITLTVGGATLTVAGASLSADMDGEGLADLFAQTTQIAIGGVTYSVEADGSTLKFTMTTDSAAAITTAASFTGNFTVAVTFGTVTQGKLDGSVNAAKDNNFLTPTTYTQTLSEYAANLKYEDIPPEVVERAKMILLQTIGVTLGAKGTPIYEKALRMAKEANGGTGGATTMWGTGEKLSAINAALALGTASDALDWEDCSWTGHPAAGVIPCAWLAAEERHKSGKDLITAIVAGYEVYQRIAMAVQPSDERWKKKGWGLTSWQIFACILPVAKLYGLDARQINQAIGMGCECSTLPVAYHATTMSDFYHYEHGYRARDGFCIAKAVEKGIRNNRDALDEPRCYTGVICGNDGSNGSGETTIRSEEADLSWLTKELGQRYLIMRTLLKHWPANMWVQTPVEIISDLVQREGFGPEDVEEIIVDPPVRARMWAPDEGFTSVTHAQFSIPFIIASFLYDPHPGAHWYTPERMKDPKRIALAKRVKAGPSPEESPMSSFKQFREERGFPMKTITVKLKDGRTFVEKMDCHPGHPDNMMSREQFADRFRVQAAPVLQGEALEKALDTLCRIEEVEDISALDGLLG